jgi:Calcineurin-like phosphoesterase
MGIFVQATADRSARSRAALTFLFLLSFAGVGNAEPLAAWVQFAGPAGETSVRAIVPAQESCPELRADGARLEMEVRAGPETLFADDDAVPKKHADFPVITCEAAPPRNAASLTLDGSQLPAPAREVKRIVIVGDTGCRIKGKKTQDCNKERKWPYRTIARLAADAEPDLVIHVGDYLYREKPCDGADDCPPSVTGYGWDVWREDFFKPSKRLFAAAPWIMVRGNHETCKRAAEGWFRFLAGPRPGGSRCPRTMPSSFVRLGSIGFLAVDSAEVANASEGKAGDDDDDEEEGDGGDGAAGDLQEKLRENYEAIKSRISGPTWLLTHAPFNAVRIGKASKQTEVDNTILQEALGSRLPADIKMVVSGHIHLFEALTFADGRPPQLVVGTGGVKHAKEPTHLGKFDDLPMAHRPLILRSFGYMLWTRGDDRANDWKGEFFDEDGTRLVTCALTERELACGEQ